MLYVTVALAMGLAIGSATNTFAQNVSTSVPANATADAYTNLFHSIVELVIALGTVAGIIISKLHIDSKVGKVVSVVVDNSKEILKNKETTKELARVSYDMLPEQAKQITDAPTVRLVELNKDVDEFKTKVDTATQVLDKYGKPVVQ